VLAVLGLPVRALTAFAAINAAVWAFRLVPLSRCDHRVYGCSSEGASLTPRISRGV